MTPTDFDVIVVGAGFAGLSAAVALTRQRARVLVLEARSRLGGRATAFPDAATGELVDNGQHILLGCYGETFDFLREIGALDHVRLQPQLSVSMIDRAGRRSRLVCPPLPAPWHLVAGILEWDALSWADRLAALRMAAPLKIGRREVQADAGWRQRPARKGQAAAEQRGGPIAASPGETVESWLVRYGQTERLREMLWRPLALAALNQPADRAAAPPFARVLAEMFGGDPRAAAIALPTRPLHLMYAEPARAFIEQHGGEVRTGAAARIRVSDRAGEAVEVEAAGARWTPKAVVASVPWFAIGDLFGVKSVTSEPVRLNVDTTSDPDTVRLKADITSDHPDVRGAVPALPPMLAGIVERAGRMSSSPIATVNLWFDRPVLDEPFVGLPGRTMQWVFDKRHVFGGSAAHLSLVSSGADRLVSQPNDQLIAAAHTELLEAIPAVRPARLVRSTVVRERHATFSLAPGQPARPATVTDVRGLFLAGDWIDTGLPATIESAVRSGHRAAAAVLALIAES